MKYYIGNNIYNELPICTLEFCRDYLLNQKVIGVDIETSRKYPKGTYDETVYKAGLDPKFSKIVMLQVGTLDKRFIIDTRAFDNKYLAKIFKPIFENKNIIKVGHNLKFEGKFFLEHFYLRLINVYDTFIMEKMLYNGFRHGNSLEALMYRYLGKKSVQSINLFSDIEKDSSFDFKVKRLMEKSWLAGKYLSEEQAIAQVESDIVAKDYVDKSTRLGFIEIGDKPFTLNQIEYGDDDITAPLKIRKIQLEKGYSTPQGRALENMTTQVLAEKEWRGIPFNQIKWKKTYGISKSLYNERLAKLNNYVIDNVPKYAGSIDLFSSVPRCTIKWTSSKEVIKLFKHLNICPKEKSKTTGRLSYTVGAKTLFRKLPNSLKGNFFKNKDVEIVDKDTLILQYLLFKKAEQLCTTFGKDWLKYVHPITYKVHTNFNQYMISSRLSSSSPNCQQLPSPKAFREPFEAPKGWKWISADYSAQEIRIAGDVHNVQSMIDFFVIGNEYWGEDFHSFSASQMMAKIKDNPDYKVPPKEFADGSKNPEFTKEHSEERTKSKNITFKLNYGGSPYTLAMDLGISEEEAEKYVYNFFKGFPGMLKSFEKKKKHALKHGWIELDTYTKSRYYFPDFKKMSKLVEQAYSLTSYSQGKKIPQEEKERLRKETEWSSIWREYMILKGKLERRALNLCIQGAAAKMTKLALILMYNIRWNKGIQEDFQVLLPVHDETNGIAKEYISQTAADIISDCMVKAGEYICKKIPMKADAVIGDYWIH